MSELAKKTVQKTTESFKPKKPEIIGMAEAAQSNIVKQEEPARFEIVKSEPCRFIGASVYLQNKGQWAKTQTSGNEDITKFLWERSGWIFEALEQIKEYAVDDIDKAGLTTWEKYDDKNALFGYYIGRFYKANTPVPCDSGGAELDYFDINEEYMAKLWVKGKLHDGKHGQFWNTPQTMNEEMAKSGYVDRSWVCFAQVFKEPDTIGFYWPCERGVQP